MIEITVDDLKEKIDRNDSFVLVKTSDNVSVCAMDAVKGNLAWCSRASGRLFALVFGVRRLTR
jgi:hypothetical protein